MKINLAVKCSVFRFFFRYLQKNIGKRMKSKLLKINSALIVLVVLFAQTTIMAQETLYPFSDKGKYGYINKTGKVVLPAQFEYAEKFYEGLAVVKQGGKRGFIDVTGKVVIPSIYDQKIDGYFSDGLACVKQAGKYFYIDKTGKTVITPQSDISYKFSEGMARFQKGLKLGYIDKTGAVVVKPEYDGAWDFKEGMG